MSTSVDVIDSTIRLRWKITKAEFDKCDFGQFATSPIFNVKIDKQDSKWSIKMYPKGHNREDEDKVMLCIQNRNHLDHTVRYDFAFETEAGYWPTDTVKELYALKDNRKERVLKPNESKGYRIGYTQDISQRFQNNKITIVATLVIDVKGKSYLGHGKAAKDFVRNVRSISDGDDLHSLSNITIVCEGKEFKVHKNILVSMSTFFKAKFIGNFEDRNTNVMEIDNSTSEIVEEMISFMSSGLVPHDIDKTARELIKLSTFYGIEALTKVCEEALIENLSSEIVIDTFIQFDKYLPLSEHRPKILKFIKTNRKEVLKSEDWDMFRTSYPKLLAEIIEAL